MRHNRPMLLGIACAAMLVVVTVGYAASALDQGQPRPEAEPLYSPYPAGLLPSDLKAEIGRVNREVDQIFKEALAQWLMLPAPSWAGNPPVLQGDGTAYVETLGKLELFDKNLSVNRNQACSFCHMPYTGFPRSCREMVRHSRRSPRPA